MPYHFDNFLGPQKERDRGKKTLILDLDETLVHSSFKPVDKADIILPIEIEGKVCNVYVLKRPGVDEFLIRLAYLYEIVIFTASLSKYADPLVDRLDKLSYGYAKLFREHCTFHEGTFFVKDLTRIGRPLKDMMIVDNSPASYLFQPENAVPISSWFTDKSDRDLFRLLPILEKIAFVEDVRDVLPLFVKDNQILFHKANQLLRTERNSSHQPSQRKEARPDVATRKKRSDLLTSYFKKSNNSLSKDSYRTDAATGEGRSRRSETLEPQRKTLLNTWTPLNVNGVAAGSSGQGNGLMASTYKHTSDSSSSALTVQKYMKVFTSTGTPVRERPNGALHSQRSHSTRKYDNSATSHSLNDHAGGNSARHGRREDSGYRGQSEGMQNQRGFSVSAGGMALERKPSLAQQKAKLVSHFEYKRTSNEGSPGGYPRAHTGGGGMYSSASASALGHKRPSEKGEQAIEANQHYMKMLS